MTDTTEHDTGGTLGEMGSIVDLGVPAPGGAFDEHHPPDAALIGDCVHCGFCLPTSCGARRWTRPAAAST
jgi:glycolate oxidase iron-sulfur subunit